MRKLLIVAALLTLTACTDGSKATKVLTDMGYTDITITGYSPFSCSEDDTFKTGFTARSPSGNRVSGTVCSAFLKGATVRFD